MALSNVQRQGFEDRLSRIKKGGDNTMGEVHIGPKSEARAGQKAKAKSTVRLKQKKKKVKIGDGPNSSLVPLAFIFGAMSMFVGQAIAYHMFSDTGLLQVNVSSEAIQPYLPNAHLFFGGMLALLFGWTFRMTSVIRFAALIAGVVVMVQYNSVLVQKAPGIYQAFFSKAYVKETLAKV